MNQSRDGPSAQPTMSLALLVQVGGVPGAPGAWSELIGVGIAGMVLPPLSPASVPVTVGGLRVRGEGETIGAPAAIAKVLCEG